jgi:hypothetical protein
VKVLGAGDITVKVFVAADAFTATARSKIEAAGGFVQLLAPTAPQAAPEAPAAEGAAADVTSAERVPAEPAAEGAADSRGAE